MERIILCGYYKQSCETLQASFLAWLDSELVQRQILQPIQNHGSSTGVHTPVGYSPAAAYGWTWTVCCGAAS